MHTGNRIPIVNSNASLRETLLEMTNKGLGMTAIVDSKHKLLGVFTDGDLRRFFDKQDDLKGAMIIDLMTSGGIRIESNKLAAEALKLMEDKKISALLVVNEENMLVGALNMHDLLQAGVA